MFDENSIIVDWFSATTRLYDSTELIKYLGLNITDFERMNGYYFYCDRLYFGGISIHYNMRCCEPEQATVLVEMSGQGCRQFETSSSVGFYKLFQDVLNGDFNITRLDIAYDDIDKTGGKGLLDIHKIAKYTLQQKFVTKWGGGEVTDSFKISGNEYPMVHALTVQFGSNTSDIKLRIYDKAQERGGLDYHWVRAEIVFRRERAKSFINEYLHGVPLGTLYGGVLRNYLRFIKIDHSRRERCTTVSWWDKFLEGCEAVKLFVKKDVEYNFPKLKNYVINQAGNCADTYILCVGYEKYLEDLRNRRSKLNAQQRDIIKEYRANQGKK